MADYFDADAPIAPERAMRAGIDRPWTNPPVIAAPGPVRELPTGLRGLGGTALDGPTRRLRRIAEIKDRDYVGLFDKEDREDLTLVLDALAAARRGITRL